MKARIVRFEVIGAILAIVAGTLLHFTFQWLGGWRPAALMSAVNESTWEHLKLAFWPMFILALIQYYAYKRNGVFSRTDKGAFCVGKAVGMYLAPLLIIAAFYGYKALLGKDVLILDILIFIIAVVIGQYTAYRIFMHADPGRLAVIIATLAIIVELAAFSLFTFYPPHAFLFRDPITGGYGIQ